MADTRRSFSSSSSGFCPTTFTYHSKRRNVALPSDPHLTLPGLVLSSCPPPHWPAFVDAASGVTLSHSQYRHCIRAGAAGLSAFGLRPGDVALLLAPNSIFSPALMLSTIHARGVITLANPLSTPAEIARQVSDSGATFVYTTPSLLPKLQRCAPMAVVLLPEQPFPQELGIHIQNLQLTDPQSIESELGRLSYHVKKMLGNSNSALPLRITTLAKLLSTEPSLLPLMPASQDDVAALLYSSGTTGPSKGVMYTNRNLIALVLIFYADEGGRLNPDLIYLCILPIFHVLYGLGVFACALPITGCSVVMMRKFSLQAMLPLIHQYRVTTIPVVPAILVALTGMEALDNYDLSSLKMMLSGGAPLSKRLIMAFHARFPNIPIKQGYALTESGGLGSIAVTKEEFRNYDSVGLLSPNTEGKIVDTVSGKHLPPNQQGELWLRGPSIMHGYLNNSKATAETVDAEGWLHTGDLCYFDKHGFLYVIDRIKELIKYKGLQVAPAELEAILLTHPDIVDAAVIPLPDEVAGQIPMAFVVKRPKSIVSDGDVITFVSQQVAPYKKIRRVAFIKEIPRTLAGKILRRELIAGILSKL